MENTKTDLDFLELIALDALFMCAFVLLLFSAIVAPAHNIFAINLTFAFGLITLRFSTVLGKWLNYLRYHENDKLSSLLNVDPSSARWMFINFGVKGYVLMFRIAAVIMAGFSFYHLVRYFTGW